MPLFSIPIGPGVPALPPGPLAPLQAPLVMTADDPSVSGSQQQRPVDQWGIFLNGAQAILPDSVVNFAFKQDWFDSDYPVEQGGFRTYDKVISPFDVRIRLSKGGSDADRQQFLDTLGSISASTSLFEVRTPEITYLSVNITHFDFRRTSANGLGLIVADVWGVQVNVTGAVSFANTAAPSGADPVNGGVVQPSAATPAQAAEATVAT